MITPYNIAPDFVRKFRAGPSILDLFGKCRRAWALRYIAGHDSYNVTWAEVRDHVYDKSLRMYVPPGGGQGPAIAPRQRSTALGTEAHRIVESHYLGRAVAADWTTFPGQVAQAWLDVMPGPEACTEVYTEIAVQLEPPPDIAGAPVLEGTSDLLLKLDLQGFHTATDGWLLGDWKTTKAKEKDDFTYQPLAYDVKRMERRDREGNTYVIEVQPLYTNSQGVLYPLAAMRRLGLDSIPCRWAYSITDPAKRREARATDFVQTREHAEAAARPLFQAAAEMRAIYDAVAHMEPLAAALSVPATGAPSACEAFGGCPHSVERGGACTAPLEMTTGQRMLAERAAAAKTCAPAPAVVPLEALLRRSIDQTRKERYMSPFQKKLQELQNAQAVTAPPAVTRDADTGEVLNPQPDAPVSVAETADVLSAPVLGQAQTVVATVTAEIGPEAVIADMTSQVEAAVADAPPPRRGPGRPRGSRNKAPAAIAAVTVPMGDVSEVEDDPDDIQVGTLSGEPHPEAVGVTDKIEALRREAAAEAFHAFDGGGAAAAARAEALYAEAQDLTLSQLAAAAKAHGCRIVVRFDGLKEKANGA